MPNFSKGKPRNKASFKTKSANVSKVWFGACFTSTDILGYGARVKKVTRQALSVHRCFVPVFAVKIFKTCSLCVESDRAGFGFFGPGIGFPGGDCRRAYQK
jgi:hypothetical protein